MKRNSLSAAVPLMFTVIGYLLNGSLVIYKLFQLESDWEKVLFFVMVAVYISWSVWEVRISLAEAKMDNVRKDKLTLELAGVIKNFMLVGALAATSTIHVSNWMAGMGIMFVGLVLRVAAIQAIGPSYTHGIRELVGEPATTGPYRYIRHPSYMGTLIIHTGLVLILFNWFSFIGLILWYVNAIFRIHVEEQQLFRNPSYAKYAEETSYRLIPLAW